MEWQLRFYLSPYDSSDYSRCNTMLGLAQQELLTERYKFQCESESSFKVIDPNNKAKNRTISIKGEAFSVQFENVTSLLYSCQKFSQNMMTGVLSEQRNKCSALTKEFKDENVFDYAQATKCCSGEESG